MDEGTRLWPLYIYSYLNVCDHLFLTKDIHVCGLAVGSAGRNLSRTDGRGPGWWITGILSKK